MLDRVRTAPLHPMASTRSLQLREQVSNKAGCFPGKTLAPQVITR